MDTLERVASDDDVAQGSTVLEDEDGVIGSGVLVRVAGLSTVELHVGVVVDAGDGAGLWEGCDVAGAGWDVEGLRGDKAGQGGGNGGGLEMHGERLEVSKTVFIE